MPPYRVGLMYLTDFTASTTVTVPFFSLKVKSVNREAYRTINFDRLLNVEPYCTIIGIITHV